MSIAGNYNVLLGTGSRLPRPADDHQIVIGTSGETVYLGGAGVASAGGVIISASGVTLSGVATLTVRDSAGAAGQALLSGGAGAAPYWGPALPVVLQTYAGQANPFAPPAPLASLYTVSGPLSGPTAPNANWALTLPAPAGALGQAVWLKSAATASGTVTTAVTPTVVTLGGTAAHNAVVLQQGDSGVFQSDGARWVVLSANTVFATLG
ncbi:MAG: hypothetical protein EBS05_26275 [Proteobacteria bacterium]|nr:hypothetical protein [Pseudomonadota bacterium]